MLPPPPSAQALGDLLLIYYERGVHSFRKRLSPWAVNAAAGLVSAYSVTMMAICLLACVVPTRRALRIEPTDALKAE